MMESLKKPPPELVLEHVMVNVVFLTRIVYKNNMEAKTKTTTYIYTYRNDQVHLSKDSRIDGSLRRGSRRNFETFATLLGILPKYQRKKRKGTRTCQHKISPKCCRRNFSI